MADEYSTDLDPEIIKDFFDEFDEMYELVTSAMDQIQDDGKPDPRAIDSLFRGVHSIKSNLRMVGLKDISTMVHHLENVLEHVRRNSFPYTAKQGDVIRLGLEEARIAANKSFDNEAVSDELVFIANAIEHICTNDEKARNDAIEIALNLLDPFAKNKANQQTNESSPEADQIEATSTSNQENHKQVEISDYDYLEEDLEFFEAIAHSVEHRLHDNTERHKQILTLVLRMNEVAGNAVSKHQLKAAVCIANYGLGVLPVKLLNKKMLEDEDEAQLKQHPVISSKFFNALPYWKTASDIVLQMHEHVNGHGYPNNYTSENICDGAKILAIAHTYAAMLHARPYASITTRTIMAAILEINKSAGTQFSEYWVDIFNKTIKELHQVSLQPPAIYASPSRFDGGSFD